MVGERATKRLADAAWNRLKGFGVLPVLLGGTGLDTSGQPSLDGSLPVPHLAANLQTWRPIPADASDAVSTAAPRAGPAQHPWRPASGQRHGCPLSPHHPGGGHSARRGDPGPVVSRGPQGRGDRGSSPNSAVTPCVLTTTDRAFWQISGKRRFGVLWACNRPGIVSGLSCWFGVEPPAGIEPATPSLPFVLPRTCNKAPAGQWTVSVRS
jgi:hypothetical protein